MMTAAARSVRGVTGSYTNVVGLPLDEVRDLLHKHGILTEDSPRRHPFSVPPW